MTIRIDNILNISGIRITAAISRYSRFSQERSTGGYWVHCRFAQTPVPKYVTIHPIAPVNELVSTLFSTGVLLPAFVRPTLSIVHYGRCTSNIAGHIQCWTRRKSVEIFLTYTTTLNVGLLHTGDSDTLIYSGDKK